jgi:hypothetical protein
MITAETIAENWEKLFKHFEQFPEPRRTNIEKFYTRHQERIMMMPASHKKEYHNAFPGGYVDHVLRVVDCALKLHKVWEEMGTDTSTYTLEELIFSAINHDLGKIGDEQNESYIPQTDQWRKEKLGEDYMFNDKLDFVSVPDRSLFLLQENNIQYSLNEMIAIKIHDGLYDEANKKYLSTFMAEQKPRTALPFIIHQADLMASRIEWEKIWLPKFKTNVNKLMGTNIVSASIERKTPIKTKALGSIKSTNLKNMLDNL